MSSIGSPTGAAPTDTGRIATEARGHLFNAGSLGRYRDVLARGVDRVARRVAEADAPFTGVTPDPA